MDSISEIRVEYKRILGEPMPPLIAITGASSGIGAETARLFSAKGHPVALLARRKEKLESLQKELQSPSYVFPVDVRSYKEVKTAFERIEEKHGPIDLLVNNAGGAFGLDKAQDA